MSTTSLETALAPIPLSREEKEQQVETPRANPVIGRLRDIGNTCKAAILRVQYSKPPAGISIEETHAVNTAYRNWARNIINPYAPGWESVVFESFLTSQFPQYATNQEIRMYLGRVFTRCL